MLFLTALPSPFDPRGKLDLGALRAHVLWLMAKGVDGFVPTAITGEFLYLSDREREAVHRTVLDAARGMPVYPFTWDPNPATTRYLTDAAAEQGASGAVVPPPLLYRLDDDAIAAWYRLVRENSGLPVLAYHDPGRLCSGVHHETYVALRKEGVLAGIVDGSGDPWRLQRLCDVDPGAVFGGSDRLLVDAPQIRFLGGFVSVIANLWPDFCIRILRNREDQLRAALLDRVATVEAAGGVRAMKATLGMGCRAPLIRPDESGLDRIPARER
ncbi:MAG: dihydrodipicolinate synthase family protein [Alphaproteobacteria bacterium]|nr:dihydrodipicolinate synthase family protein [Alphaproteobacteria bacterium]